MSQLPDKHFVFVTGVHRSGTTILHDALRAHPDVSGFSDTGAIKNEGQHLQTVFPAARQFGGPGKFAFDSDSFMDETHALAMPASALKIFDSWKEHWDLDRRFLLEKSPPTIVRTRFFQHLFPQSSFVVVLRHPVAVAYATLKWCPSPIFALIEHTLRCYERLLADKDHIHNLFVCHYESFVADPNQLLLRIDEFLDIAGHGPAPQVDHRRSDSYFERWRRETAAPETIRAFEDVFAERLASFGYSFGSTEPDTPIGWIQSGS